MENNVYLKSRYLNHDKDKGIENQSLKGENEDGHSVFVRASITSLGHKVNDETGLANGKLVSEHQQLNPSSNLIQQRKPKMIPSGNSGLFSLTTLHWMNGLMWNAGKRGLKDFSWILSNPDCAADNFERLDVLWQEEQKKDSSKVSFSNVVWQFQKTRQFAFIFTVAMTMILIFLGPAYIFRKILEYLEDLNHSQPLWHGLLLVLCLGISEFLRICFFTLAWNIGNVTGIRLRGAVLSLIYKKILRSRALGEQSVGEIINICTADAFVIYESAALGCFVWATPMSLVAVIIYSCILLHYWALIGCAFFIASFPMQAVISKITSSSRFKAFDFMDKRISLMNDILNSIKLIKMYAWENSFINKIADLRQQEVKYMHIANCAQSISITISPLIPIFAYSLIFIVYIVTGHDIKPDEAFSLISVFIAARFALGIFPNALRAITESKVACKRIQDLLATPNFVLPANEKPDLNSIKAIHLESVTFACEENKEQKRNIPNAKQRFSRDKLRVSRRLSQISYSMDRSRNFCDLISGISMTVEKGTLVGLCGTVGSGKSSLLSGILGEMRLTRGIMELYGNITYVPQQAWIFKGTVRENILFGLQYNPNLYDEVIQVSNLIQDFKQLSRGDLTAIGERGVNLSGGQRQRISLARALYNNGDIYLLDDPLSAVDPKVGRHIFNQAILNFLKNKTIIFASHQLQFLQECDYIYVLKDGQIWEKGTHTQLMAQNREYSLLHKKHIGDEDMANNENYENPNMELEAIDDFEEDKTEDQLIVSEEIQSGGIKFSVFLSFLKESGGIFFNLIVYLFFFIFVGLTIFNTSWLSIWLKNGSGKHYYPENTTNVTLMDRPIYVNAFSYSLLFILVTGIIKGQLFMLGARFASKNLHQKMLNSIMYGTQTFFDSNPVGRILNRFSRDLEEVDSRLPFFTEFFITVVLICLGSVIQMIMVNPYLTVVVVVLFIIMFLMDKRFKVSLNELKRCDNVTRSPLISHLTITMQGLPTVRAFKRQNQFIEKFNNLVDDNSVPFSLFNFGIRWYSWRVDIITVAMIVLTALILVINNKTGAAEAGLALSSAFQITILFQLLMRLKSDTESRYVSVERIRNYIKTVPQESNNHIQIEPFNDWPNFGNIQFENVCLQYREGLPLALDDVSFSITAGENVGIVGRTGSGKSTLGTALFRLVEIKSGQINIDGINIQDLLLNPLRSRLSIIPQEPVLFSGSIRYNLDPFNQYKDADLWTALEKVQLKDRISIENKQLESMIDSDGDNFSVGQRQLICLARAILRNSKILLLDEATASIDTETDSVIQEIIKREFSQCTILTIAHRLNTIMDCDKILVMQAGKVMEFDSPSSLMSRPDSLFSSMVRDAGLHLPSKNQNSNKERIERSEL